MTTLSPSKEALIAPIEQASMTAHTLAWAAVNSGTRHISGLGTSPLCSRTHSPRCPAVSS
ncbi:hypothetical protein ACVWZA_000478 [Sphingomonas sp. UYAg733]